MAGVNGSLNDIEQPLLFDQRTGSLNSIEQPLPSDQPTVDPEAAPGVGDTSAAASRDTVAAASVAAAASMAAAAPTTAASPVVQGELLSFGNADGSTDHRLEPWEASLLGAVMGEGRKEVQFESTVHAVRQVEGGLQANLTLKFKYPESFIQDVFWKDEPEWREPRDGQRHAISKVNEVYNIIPFMIENEMERTQTSWFCEKFMENGQWMVQERISLVSSLTSVSFSRFFPFELLIFFFKVQMDGTANTKLVNLRPSGAGCRAGLFRKKTSPFRMHNSFDELPDNWKTKSEDDLKKFIAERGLKLHGATTREQLIERLMKPHLGRWDLVIRGVNIFNKWVSGKMDRLRERTCCSVHLPFEGIEFRTHDMRPDHLCRMYARDARKSVLHTRDPRGAPEPQTTVIASFIFEGEAVENTFKYVGVSSVMFLLAVFLPAMELGDMVQTGLGMILADVGLLYVLPPNNHFTTTERIIVGQLIALILLTWITGVLSDKFGVFKADDHIFFFGWVTILVVVGSALFLAIEYLKFWRLRLEIKDGLWAAAKGRKIGFYRRVQDDF